MEAQSTCKCDAFRLSAADALDGLYGLSFPQWARGQPLVTEYNPPSGVMPAALWHAPMPINPVHNIWFTAEEASLCCQL